MIRKLALVGGVGVVWLVTFLVMGGSAVPKINFNATTPSATTGPQAGPIETVAPIGPSTPTASPNPQSPSGVASKAEALAKSAPLKGAVLQARPKPRRSLPPSLTFRIATFNVLGSSHTAGGKKRASGVTRMNAATQLILAKGFSIVGVRAGEYARRFPDRGARIAGEVAKLASEGAIKPVIDRVLPLSHWREGFDAMANGELVGKLVLRP